jgi:hypothetical protein
MSATPTEFREHFSRLFFLAGAMAALFTLIYFWRGDVLRAGNTLFFAVFHGSAGMLGAIIALIFGGSHFAFWSRAKWTGTDFGADAQRYAKLLWVSNRIGFAGLLLLLITLISQLGKTRELLDHVLGLLTWLLIAIIVSHKALMYEVAERAKGEQDCPAQWLTQAMFSCLLAVPAGQAVSHATNCHPATAALWGFLIAVAGFMLLRKLALPEVGGCPAPVDALAEDDSSTGSDSPSQSAGS